MHVTLAPEGIGYHVLSPLRRGASDHGVVPCTPDDPARPWTGACAALSDLMSGQMRRGLRLNIVVSDRLARYQMLPWRPGIVSRAEWRAYAMHRFESVYGEAMRSWRLKIELVPPGRPSLACALDVDLIDALRAVAVANTSRLVAVRPNFISLFSQRRHSLRGDHLWFGTVEERHVCLGVLTDRSWRAVRNEAAADGWLAALPGMIRRIEVGLAASRPGTLYLCGDIDGDAAPEFIGGLPLRVIETRPPRGQARPEQAMVMEG
jgi:hypothetical protein